MSKSSKGQNITISGCRFVGSEINADALGVAQAIADAVGAIARSNEAAAVAIQRLANNFATAQLPTLLRIDGTGVGINDTFVGAHEFDRKAKP